jgi:hypothetical protein
MRRHLYMRLRWLGLCGLGVVCEWQFGKRIFVLVGPVAIEFGFDY